MANKESSDKTGYVVDVKILDVEKRYKPGPKHYVCLTKIYHNKNIYRFLGLCYSSHLGKSCKFIHYLSTLCTIL
jgi:hypothetical protein